MYTLQALTSHHSVYTTLKCPHYPEDRGKQLFHSPLTKYATAKTGVYPIFKTRDVKVYGGHILEHIFPPNRG